MRRSDAWLFVLTATLVGSIFWCEPAQDTTSLRLVASTGSASAHADSSTIEAVDFQRDVLPILSNRCFACHGPDEAARQADLRLDQRDAVLQHGAIRPGKAGASLLLKRVTADDPDLLMPPPESKQALTDEEVEILRRWIDAGAAYTPHWAFQAPTRPALPAGDDPWIVNEIDRFVLARMASRGLRPSPAASRETLIRRVSLDLTGLLPTPDEVEAFVDDPAPDAYERLVDRLLASPHYGERMARRWLDLARYADSNGYTVDGPRSIWPYRDWVIDALNADMPFDTFTIHQLAGDLIEDADVASRVATGFHRNTGFNEEGGADPEQFRVERTINRVNTTGTVWLGLTVACAQCHTHKFDPITQHEYFQLYAFFNSVDEPSIRVPSPESASRLARLDADLNALRKRIAEAERRAVESAGQPPLTPTWKILTGATQPRAKGATLTVQDDQSILASGDNPKVDTYTLTFDLGGEVPTALRLEALTHGSLPRGGPGRAANGNFVLAQLQVEIDGTPVAIRRAVADHEQADYPIEHAWDGDPKSGWAINVKSGSMNRDREAIFVLDVDVAEITTADELTIRMTAYDRPDTRQYNLGRFRWSMTGDAITETLVPTTVAAALATAPDTRTDEQRALARSFVARYDPDVAKLTEQLADVEAERDALAGSVPRTLVMQERTMPRDSFVHVRGDFLRKGDPVQPDTPAVFPAMNARGDRATREDLARWLVSDDHPLTSRVVVNRMWQHFFGRGIVETENDFGIQGARPTHPDLLDWLATEFIAQDWRMKSMHRQIVLSATYRQASMFREEAESIDPTNTWLHRQNRLRLDAETIRDASLCASGLLNPEIGGPGVHPPQPDEVFSFTQNVKRWPTATGPDRYRRGLYIYLWRQSQHPLLTTFDGPDAQEACTRRDRSNTPMQALMLANDEAFYEFAHVFGSNLAALEGSDESRLGHAFRRALGRSITDAERTRLLDLLDTIRASLEQDPAAARAMVGVEEGEVTAQAAWIAVARVILNLDEFITRE